jgi:Fur family zinc uptake transcriptional regulator
MTQDALSPHNHNHCIDQALTQARSLCEQQGVRLTAIRKRVLELVWQSHKPVGAYDLLPALAEDGFNSAPPTVYRALDFLLELGLVHRISSLNAFTGCTNPGHQHPSCFFLCRQCGIAQELDSAAVSRLSAEVEQSLGVTVEHQITELSGLCPKCTEQPLD